MYRADWLLPIERGDAEQDSVLFSGLGNKPHAVSLVSWLYGRFSPMTWDTMGVCVNIEGMELAICAGHQDGKGIDCAAGTLNPCWVGWCLNETNICFKVE